MLLSGLFDTNYSQEDDEKNTVSGGYDALA